MKCLSFTALLLSLAWTAHAQELPVPGEKNTDWTLLSSKVWPTQFRSADRMPNAIPSLVGSNGRRHLSWDSNRQLHYEWNSPPFTWTPVDSVIVREGATGTIYTYRRNGPPSKPRQWRRITPAK